MAQRHVTLAITARDAWVILTNAVDNATTAARVQNTGAAVITVQATATATAPTSAQGAINLLPGDILPSTQTLAQLFPGVTSPAHIWGRCDADGSVSVSHA